ncbi:MAG: diacylglycerol kinase [bacterium]|nr:MAG: diacylglycerol kinase [bacterium]
MTNKTVHSSKSFGLIVNGHAGKVKSGAYKVEDFQAIFKDRGLIRETQSLEDIPIVLKEFQKAGIDILFIYGGDGTHQKVISQMIASDVQFTYVAPLKGGTMNMLVKDIKLGGQAKSVAKRIVDRYDPVNNLLPSFQKAVLKVTTDSRDPLFGFYFANGIIYNILKKYYEQPSSVANAIRVTLGGLLGSILPHHSYSPYFKPSQCQVIADGKPLKWNESLGIMLSTMNRVVFGMTPFGKDTLSKKQFNFIAYTFHKRELLWRFVFLAKGRWMNPPSADPYNLEFVELTCRSGYVLDGEVYDVCEGATTGIEVGAYLNIPVISQPITAPRS